MAIRNNKIVVDLNKVQYAYFYYRNQYGHIVTLKSNQPSVRGMPVYGEREAHHHPDYPFETEYQRAERLGLLDIWTPELQLKLTANTHLIYTGDKAVSLNEAWKAKIFGKKK